MDNLWLMPLLISMVDSSKFALPMCTFNYDRYKKYGDDE